MRVRNIPGVSFIVVLALWQLACMCLDLPVYFLPRPSLIVDAFVRSPMGYLSHGAYTIAEVLGGILLSCALTFGVGYFSYQSVTFGRIARQFVVVLQTIPSFIFMPLLVLWFGFGIVPKMVIVTLSAFFPMALSFIDALHNTPQCYIEIEHAYGCIKKWGAFWHVRLPAAMPKLLSSLKLGCIQGTLAVIAADWLGAHQGLGYLILNYYSRLQITELFVCVLLLMLMVCALTAVIDLLQKHFVFWD